jgi:hypothetical protein
MEQIVVQVRDKAKAELLLEVLAALDFVESINRSTSHEEASIGENIDDTEDFFALAGLWSQRTDDLASIRQKAWPRR